ncbi:MAG: TlpA family protein disulfide reductase [Deltaproteobacteria bacterium]|nr:TlpA family protein disulfide reductase [Deltaproteobacteria bacterium]
MTVFRLLVFVVLVAMASPALGGPVTVGDRILDLHLPVPADEAAQAELGVQGKKTFSLADLKADLIFLEVVGIYCPFCVKQAPGFKTLHGRLNKGKLKGRVAMFALAAGATEEEVKKLVGTGQYLFPVISDPDFAAHKALGDPLTPYTLVCRPDGTILYSHLGVVDDVNDLYQQIKGFLD